MRLLVRRLTQFLTRLAILEINIMNQSKTLVSLDKNGQKWREKKRLSLLYAEYLKILGYRKANNVKQCGDTIYFVRDDHGNLHVNEAWFCHSRLCPLCSWRRAIKYSANLCNMLECALNEQPHAAFLFLTLTEQNCLGSELHNRLKLMTKGFHDLTQYQKVKKNLLGYIRSTEVTVNNTTQMYHPHLHANLMVKSTYFSGKNNYVSQRQWSQLYQRARKLTYVPIVNIQAIRPNYQKNKNSILAAAQEIAKYQVKAQDIITGNIDRDLHIIEDLEEALYGTRSIAFSKSFKKLNNFEKRQHQRNEIQATWSLSNENYHIKLIYSYKKQKHLLYTT